MTSTANRLGIFLTGVGVGMAGALLYAPNAGEEMRKRLAKGADCVNDKGNQLISNIKDKVTERIDEATTAARNAAGQVIDKSKDVAHNAGRKIEETGRKLQDV